MWNKRRVETTSSWTTEDPISSNVAAQYDIKPANAATADLHVWLNYQHRHTAHRVHYTHTVLLSPLVIGAIQQTRQDVSCQREERTWFENETWKICMFLGWSTVINKFFLVIKWCGRLYTRQTCNCIFWIKYFNHVTQCVASY